MATEAIARDLGIRQGGVRSLLATARRRLGKPWRRRSRARRPPPADLSAFGLWP
jgi:DNA-directed RNA polymerase specialized sigma24 family protein